MKSLIEHTSIMVKATLRVLYSLTYVYIFYSLCWYQNGNSRII